MRRTIVGALLAALVWGCCALLPAHAAEEVVRQLDVTYDVRADGTVDVEYTIDWDFGEAGRRGIILDLVTAEPWDPDPEKLARYELSDIQVSSPTGAPAAVARSRDTEGDVELLSLQIGDPDRTLDAPRHTYVVSFTMAGALRTFDGVPELHWDLTSGAYPPIESFSSTIRAEAGPIERARCAVGERECSAEVTDGVATLTGSNAAAGESITAVAQLPAAQAGAEPVLTDRVILYPEIIRQDTVVTVADDGSAEIEERSQWLLPKERRELLVAMPARVRESWWRVRTFEVRDFRATTADGVELETRERYAPSRSYDHVGHFMTPPEGEPHVEIVATWTVPDFARSRGDVAQLEWPTMARDGDHPDAGSLTIEAPGSDTLECLPRNSRARCDAGAVVDGTTVTWRDPAEINEHTWYRLEVPAAAVGNAKGSGGIDLDTRTIVDSTAGFYGLIAALFVGMFGLGWVGERIGRVRIGNADQRWADAPPGEQGHEITEAPLAGPVPVRFEPPSNLARAGMVWHHGFDGAITAAALAQMAVRGSITLGTEPLRATRADKNLLRGPVEQALYRVLKGKERLRRGELRQLNNGAYEAANGKDISDGMFRTDRSRTPATGIYQLAAWLAPIFGVGLVWLLTSDIFLTIGAAILAFGLIRGITDGINAPTGRPLSARGSQFRDQAEGFRQYLVAAERGQIEFEADQDIFREYLPWAVLFGEVDRWVKVCEQLAKAGTIPALDTSGLGVAPSGLGQEFGRMRSSLHRTATSTSSFSGGSGGGGGGRSSFGGSGGRSGFSGRSRGGSGGGGSRARSW